MLAETLNGSLKLLLDHPTIHQSNLNFFHPFLFSSLPLYVVGLTVLCRSLISWLGTCSFALHLTSLLCGGLIAECRPEVARFVGVE